jgi:hypothetical protein
MYGAANTLIQGNEFTDLASTAILLGCTYDPLPTDPSEAAGIRQNCTPDGAADRRRPTAIGANEILTGTTVADNVIHHIGTDYSSAGGITLLFSQHTTITRNNLYDLPYTGITAGVVQGHVDQASTPQNSTNINGSNTISDNIFHDYLSVRSDGGAIYAEGHQAQYVFQADGTTIAPARTLAQGLQVTGNIAYDGPSTNFTYYDDAGSEWVNWQGNVAFGAGAGSFTPVVSVPARIFYVSPAASAAQVLVAGEGFGPATPVYIGTSPVGNVTHLSSGFMIVPIPAGTTAGQISLTPQVPGSVRLNDDDSDIAYSGFSYAGGRSYGDYRNDIHYATDNGATASLTFTGTTVTVYGEQYTDQGDIVISLDGGPRQVVSTLPSDGVRHANVAVYTSGHLSSGTHTIVVTKLSGQYSTLDGFTV